MLTGLKEVPSEKNFAVKIYTTALDYDFRFPWKSPTIERWTGSGFVIEGKRIITNAHVAGGSTFLEVQLANDSVKYPAKVKAVGHECDLAEIEIDDEEFWKKTTALQIGDTPERKQKVEVHGFPRGGEGYCITDGIVSRLENDVYVHGEQMLLSTQVSAPINPGNSGGAVLTDGKVVGVVHQGINGGQNIGYMIPASVLKHFIEQVDSKNIGFPMLAIETQTMENPYLREQYKMHKHHTGILVRSVPDVSSAKDKLKENDVIMAINGIRVYNDGTVHVGPMKRVDYRYLINNAKMGDEIVFKILRDGKRCVEKVRLTNSLGTTHVIQPLSFGVAPTYFVIAGCVVVQPVSKNFIYDMQRSYTNKQKSKADEQMLAINTVLKNKYTQGYEGFNGDIIEKVNGKEVRNLKDLMEAVESHTGKCHQIETRSNRLLIVPNLPRMSCHELLKMYEIPRDRSLDLAEPKLLQEDLLDELFGSSTEGLIFSAQEKENDAAFLPAFVACDKDKKRQALALTAH